MLTIEGPELVDLEFDEIVAGLGGYTVRWPTTGKTQPWEDDDPSHAGETESWDDEEHESQHVDDGGIDWA